MLSRPILVFDVNETLFDLESLSPLFNRIFGDPRVMREWFAQVILYSECLTLSNNYADFGTIGAAVLRMLGQVWCLEVNHQHVQDLNTHMSRMTPHPDVLESLQRLKQSGFRMVTLTNNSHAIATAQLNHAGLAVFFERIFSVDDGAHRYKPARECYGGVATSLAVKTAECLLVACHAWDTLGAASAGMQAALVKRSGNAPFGLGKQPDFVGSNLTSVVDWLLQSFR